MHTPVFEPQGSAGTRNLTALARVKTYWAEMEATTIVAQGSAIGRVAAEHYFEEVLEGARSIEAQCSKNIIF